MRRIRNRVNNPKGPKELKQVTSLEVHLTDPSIVENNPLLELIQKYGMVSPLNFASLGKHTLNVN